MCLPAFTAESALNASRYRYSGKHNAFAKSGVLPQLTLCDFAQAQCIKNAHGTGFDPSGWCDWYHANCITAGPPPIGGVGVSDGGGGIHHGPAHM